MRRSDIGKVLKGKRIIGVLSIYNKELRRAQELMRTWQRIDRIRSTEIGLINKTPRPSRLFRQFWRLWRVESPTFGGSLLVETGKCICTAERYSLILSKRALLTNLGVNIGALARGLLGMGVQKGDDIGVIMGNTSAYAMLQWACARVGAILVTLNPAYRLTELAGVFNLVGVKHLFIVPRLHNSGYVRMLAEAFPEMEKCR
ncbi:hypothetical protein B0H34DRAFT_804388 [Crassisporium funariophilum]|nr:hypothetical protein B0H34DRAFT_804388 [Crassisporium funariophilum]